MAWSDKLADMLRLNDGEQAYVGYPQMQVGLNKPRQAGYATGFLEGATGMDSMQPKNPITDPNYDQYAQGKNTGELVNIGAMALPAYATALKAGAPKAADMIGNYMVKTGGIQPMFIGPESAMWNSVDAGKAALMLKKGADKKEVWNKYMTAKSPEGAFVQEISDAESKAIPIKDIKSWGSRQDLLHGNKTTGGVDEFLEHSELEKAYPNGIMNFGNADKRATMTVTPVKSQSGGLSPDENIMLGLNDRRNPEATVDRGTALHELQHIIQRKENWAKGGNPEEFAQALSKVNDKIGDYNTQMSALVKKMDNPNTNAAEKIAAKQDYDKLMDEKLKLVPLAQSDPMDLYNKLAGEAQARVTEVRKDLNMAQRRDNYPFEQGQYGYDLDPKDLIIKDTPYGLDRRSLIEKLINKSGN
jgi:hypothetical protein